MKTRVGCILGLSLCMVFASYLFAGDGQPSPSSAAQLPGVRVLDSISEQYTPVTFDHRKHVAIADGCGACHHHGNGNTASCKECHALTPSAFKASVVNSFIACSSCHGEFDRENPAMPGLKVAYHKKCFDCHRGMGDLGSGPAACTQMCHAEKTATSGRKTR